MGGGCSKAAAHSRHGERAAQNRGKTWVGLEGRGYCSFPGSPSLQVGPPRDRRGNPVATPAPSKPPQPRGATRTAILAVCLEFSLPSGTGSLQTASLALPQGRARERGGELSASDWVSGRAAGVSGREWPPGPAFPAALTPWPLRVFLHPPPLCPRGRPRESRVHVGKGASGLRLFFLLNWLNWRQK